jgi:hypothetical protein
LDRPAWHGRDKAPRPQVAIFFRTPPEKETASRALKTNVRESFHFLSHQDALPSGAALEAALLIRGGLV